MGFLLQRLLAGRWKRPATVVLAAAVLLNLFQTWQWGAGLIDRERMTRASYAALFGRVSRPPGFERLLLVNRFFDGEERLADEAGYRRRLLYRNAFDDRTEGVLVLTGEQPYSPGPDVPYRRLTGKDHAWLRISARLWVDSGATDPPRMVCAFHHRGGSYKYVARTWDPATVRHGAWNRLSFDYLTPEVRSPDDDLKVYLWNQPGGTWRADDLQVELFEPR